MLQIWNTQYMLTKVVKSETENANVDVGAILALQKETWLSVNSESLCHSKKQAYVVNVSIKSFAN